MTTAWAHLPNAKHIDWVFADLKAHPENWNAAQDAAWDAAQDAAWRAARGAAWRAAQDAAWNAARGAAWNAAWNAAQDAAWDAAWDAVAALIAWDDSGTVLLLPDDAITLLVACGNPQAILLQPAAKVLSLKERGLV